MTIGYADSAYGDCHHYHLDAAQSLAELHKKCTRAEAKYLVTVYMISYNSKYTIDCNTDQWVE